ncbi:MAG: hypothetical protein QM760_05855 [Nibricoccus sp.]
MRPFLCILTLVLAVGCATKLSESEIVAYFDGQKGRVLSEEKVEGCTAVTIGDGLIEYVPSALPKSGWAVVWRVDATQLAQLNAGSSERLVGRIVSWRIIGDRSKVRIPISYSTG